MISALLLLALTQNPEVPAEITPVPVGPEQTVAVPVMPADIIEPRGCGRWQADGLGEGPIALGFLSADVATGRRVCPRSEVGLGGRLQAIIDTPNFYGNLVGDGLVFGSFAINDKTEIFGTLEAIEYNYVQTSLKGSTLTLGTLTVGATRHIYGTDRFLGALSARVMLPTSLVNPSSRDIGVELGHATTWRPASVLEVHTYLGFDFNAGLGGGPSIPRVGGVLTAGLQFSPVSFAALVVDFTGRLSMLKNYVAPTVALRFRVMRVGIELAGTLPLAGSDRHDFIAGGRFNFRF